MASTTSENRKRNEKKITEQEKAHFVSRITVTLTREKEIPYCYYYLRVLYFANFCDLEKKIAKLSTRKNFYRHIWHSGVCTITNCVMFATLEHA